MLSLALPAMAESLPLGSSTQQAIIEKQRFEIAAYRPEACNPQAILLVMPGKKRDNFTYRDASIPLADSTCAIVYSPSFPKSRFPVQDYQHGGFPLHPNTFPTTTLIISMEEWAKQNAGLPYLPVILIGHSAGAQFLSRVAAYTPGSELGTILMNAGTYVEPTSNIPPPYGFNVQDDALQKQYLSEKLTILIGAEDIRPPIATDAAETQGRNRLERAQQTFNQGKQAAIRLKTPFNWQINIVPKTGHNAKKMLASPELREAITRLLNPASSQ